MSEVGRYRRAYPRLFRHPQFKALSPTVRLLVTYLLWGPQSNRIGLFYMSVNTAAEDMKAGADTVRNGIADICEAYGWMFDAVAGVFYIPTWWRWNDPGSPKILQGNLKDLSEIPPCGLVETFAQNMRYLSPNLHATFLECIAIRIPKGTPTQYQYQEQNQKQEQEQRAPRGFERKKSLRAVGAEPSNQLVSIARETLKLTNPNAKIEELTEAFRHVSQGKAAGATRTDIEAALAVALSERRQATG